MVVTTHEGVPQEFYGAKLIGSRRLLCNLISDNIYILMVHFTFLLIYLFTVIIPHCLFFSRLFLPFCALSFPCPWYQKVPLSLALSPRIISEVARFKPDIIHASSPGIMASLTSPSCFCLIYCYFSFIY